MRVRGREGWEGEGCHPARLLLAGVGVFLLISGGGVRVREEFLGSWEGARGTGKNQGRIRVTGGEIWGSRGKGREKGEVGEGASSVRGIA